MTIRGIMRLESTQAQGDADRTKTAREGVDRTLKQEAEWNKDQYTHALAEVAHDKEARSTQSGWTLAFAIILGPLIGTAIGNAIGGAAAEGDKKAAESEKKLGGLADLQEQQAMDRFAKARNNLDDATKSEQDTNKFRHELIDNSWTGIT